MTHTSPAAHHEPLASTGSHTGLLLTIGIGLAAIGALLVVLGSRGFGRRRAH